MLPKESLTGRRMVVHTLCSADAVGRPKRIFGKLVKFVASTIRSFSSSVSLLCETGVPCPIETGRFPAKNIQKNQQDRLRGCPIDKVSCGSPVVPVWENENHS